MMKHEMVKNEGNKAWRLLCLTALIAAMIFSSLYLTKPVFASDGVEWWNFRNNDENNGVTSVETPSNKNETSLKWGSQMGSGWEYSCTPPLIINGYVYTAANQYVYKLDKETGKQVAKSEKLEGDCGYAMNPVTYDKDDGYIFVPISSGRIQCVDAKTLKSVWVSETLEGYQTVAPITYKNGYVYAGTWKGTTDSSTSGGASGSVAGGASDGVYLCLSAKDGSTKWKFKTSAVDGIARGFYWAGSYATDEYVIFGSEDGSDESSETAVLYSVDTETGEVIDTIDGIYGNIRTTVVYHEGYVYFASKGGWLCKVKVKTDGSFDHDTFSKYEMSGENEMTAAPVVHDGRIYIGVLGSSSGRFNPDGGHKFAVFNDDEMLSQSSLAYTVATFGYPQAAALLSTATEKTDGKVRVYFTTNAYDSNKNEGGGIYYFEDSAGQTSATATELFTPESSMRQYCISTICCDNEGTLYYKNDSGYLMAVQKNRAYLKGVAVTDDNGKTPQWSEEFTTGVLNYDLTTESKSDYVKIKLDLPSKQTATVNGKTYSSNMKVALTNGKGNVEIKVSYDGYERTYTLSVGLSSDNAYLSDLYVTEENASTAEQLSLNQAFDMNTYAYTLKENYKGSYNKLNLWVVPQNTSAKVTVTPVSGVGNDADHSLDDDGNIIATGKRYPVYFIKGVQTAEVKITVTPQNGDTTKKQEYTVTLTKDASVNDEVGLSTLTLNRSTLKLYTSGTGTTYTLKAEQLGSSEGETAALTWRSSNESVATVDSEGNVTAVGEGTANIFVENGTDEASCEVTVVPHTLKLSASSLTLYTCSGYNSYKIVGTADGSKGNSAVKYKVTKGSSYVSVSSGGKVKAKKAGKATVTATYNGISKTVKVTVKKAVFSLKKSSYTVKTGKKATIKVKSRTPKGKVTYKSKNKKIATVTSKGVIKAKKKGTTYITVKCNGITKKVKVKVK